MLLELVPNLSAESGSCAELITQDSPDNLCPCKNVRRRCDLKKKKEERPMVMGYQPRTDRRRFRQGALRVDKDGKMMLTDAGQEYLQKCSAKHGSITL